jgi:hypothetical protein
MTRAYNSRRSRERDQRFAQPRRTQSFRVEQAARAEATNVQGVDNFTSLLEGLGDAAFGGSLKSATTFAMTVVKTEAEKNANNFKGHLDEEYGHLLRNGRHVVRPFTSKSVAKRSGLSRDKNSAMSIVGVEHWAFYAVQFVERGYTRVNGLNVPAQPWLVPAFESSRKKIIDRFGLKMSKQMEKEIKKRNTRQWQYSRPGG